MPIYEYQCSNCGHLLEAFQKVSDSPITTCPNCQTDNLNKIISKTSFQLKGTGWYVTDIRDKDKPKPQTESNGANESKKDTKEPVNSTQTDKIAKSSEAKEGKKNGDEKSKK